MRLFIILPVFCFIFCLLPFSNGEQKWKYCRVINNQLWGEVWSSNFDNETELTNLWNVQHEDSYCSGNGINQLNCNIKNNVVVKDGYVFLIAKHKKYSDKEYTGATMTTHQAFTHGRWEIRARFPRGDLLRPSMFTRNESELFWHDLGQIDMGSYGQGRELFRGIHYAHSTNKYHKADMPFDGTSTAKHLLTNMFHVYGVEWTPEGVRFFWDDSYTHWYNFSEKLPMEPWHNIRLQIGVGGVTLGNMMPTNTTDESWECPALIVDYVRIYESATSYQCGIYSNINLKYKNQFQNDDKIDAICEEYRPKVIPKEDTENSLVYPHIGQIFTYGMILMAAIVIIWIILQIRAIRRKLDRDQENRNKIEMLFKEMKL